MNRCVTRFLFFVCLLLLTVPACRQGPSGTTAEKKKHRSKHGVHRMESTPLTRPGNAIFGAVQEVLQTLEQEPDTDWSDVNLDVLRRHLVDMHEFTVNVRISDRKPLDRGLSFTAEPKTKRSRDALRRVLKAHPPMLKNEKGWTMESRKTEDGYRITVKSSDKKEAKKIQALGYIGILAAGAHHKKHHWMIATGQTPHEK